MVAQLEMKVTNNTLKFAHSLSRILPQEFAKASDRAAKLLLEKVRESIQETSKAPTGKLAGSFSTSIRQRGGTIYVRLISKSPYALAVDKGGRYTTPGTFTIPLSPKARAAGRPRNFPGKLFRKPGGRILLQRGGAGGGVTPQYKLTNTIRLRPKKYINRTAEKVRPRILNYYRTALKTSHRKAAQGVR